MEVVIYRLLEVMMYILFEVLRSTILATGSHGIQQESHRILQENTGNRWNMEAGFWPEKIRKFSGRNTTLTRSPELPGTGSFRTVLFGPGGVGNTARRVDKANVVPDYKKLYQYNNAHGIIQKCKEKQVFPVCNTIIREEKFVVINSLFWNKGLYSV